MNAFNTYRVSYCEWQTFAINLSARTPEEACELAEHIRGTIGQHPFEECDGASEDFHAQKLNCHAHVALERAQTAKRKGGRS